MQPTMPHRINVSRSPAKLRRTGAFILQWIHSNFAIAHSYLKSFFTSAFYLLQEVAGLDRLTSLDVKLYAT
jgi:hypothetical protein